jgi:hypothetical protein
MVAGVRVHTIAVRQLPPSEAARDQEMSLLLGHHRIMGAAKQALVMMVL